MIDIICYVQNYYKPRMYRQKAQKDYLNLAKCKKRTAKKIRKTIKTQLQYIRRDLRYIDAFLEEIDLCDDLSKQLATIRTLVEQQQYMYENKVHSVPDRVFLIELLVSVSRTSDLSSEEKQKHQLSLEQSLI